MRRVLALLALMVGLAPRAEAHVTSTGLAVLDVEDGRLSYRLTLVGTELDDDNKRILTAAADGQSSAAAQVAAAMRTSARFLMAGVACAPGRIAIQGSRSGDSKIVLEMSLRCPQSTGTLTIRDEWPEVLGSHFQTVMSVHAGGHPSAEFAFVDDRREATIELGRAVATDWLSFIGMGAQHILTGTDHLLFLLALLGLSRSLWPIVRIVTGFTVAHSITLSLAALGLVDVSARLVEPAIAVTIIWVALENTVAPGATRWRWVIAAAFGLVHGLGFASGLTELGLPRDALVRALVGFNLGVEIGQLAFVAAVMPLVVWLAKPGRFPALPRLLSVLVAGMGAVWLIERVLMLG